MMSQETQEYLLVTANDWQLRCHLLILQKMGHHHEVDKYKIARMHLINLHPREQQSKDGS